MNSVLRSRSAKVFLVKFWGPLLCIIIAVGVFGGDFPSRRLWLVLPFLLAALFGLSIASLEVRGDTLRYRRLFKWTVINDEVLEARVECPPLIGSLRLKRFVFPWGRLYFALDSNTESNPFRRGPFPLVGYLNREDSHREGGKSVPSSIRFTNFSLLLAASVGILTCLVMFYVIPRDFFGGFLPSATVNMPILLRGLFQFTKLFGSSVVQLVGIAIMVILAVSKRNKPESWFYAFLSGFAAAFIVARLLL